MGESQESETDLSIGRRIGTVSVPIGRNLRRSHRPFVFAASVLDATVASIQFRPLRVLVASQPGFLKIDTMTEQKIEYFDAKYLDPKFPIVKADPSVDDVIKSMRTSDYMFMGGTMAGTWSYGYLLGKPVRGPTAVMCASAGFTFAMFYTMQTIRSRLLGYRENAKEVNKWGLAPVQPRRVDIVDRRFPERQSMISSPPLNWNNYD